MSKLLAKETMFESNGTKYIVKEQYVKEWITHQIWRVLGSTKTKVVKYSAQWKYAWEKVKLLYYNGWLREVTNDPSWFWTRADLA